MGTLPRLLMFLSNLLFLLAIFRGSGCVIVKSEGVRRQFIIFRKEREKNIVHDSKIVEEERMTNKPIRKQGSASTAKYGVFGIA